MRARWIVPIIVVGILACVCLPLGLIWLGGRLKHTPGAGPAVRIVGPNHGDRVPMERTVLVRSEARDTAGLVTQVELWVDGELQRVHGAEGLGDAAHLYAAQGWKPSSPGSHTVMARAVNSSGGVEQATIVVEAVEGIVGFGPEGEEVLASDLTTEAYVALEGQTVGDIAEIRGVPEDDILQINPELDADEPLVEGQVVQVPFDRGSASEEREEEEEESGVGPQLGGEEQQLAARVIYHDYQESMWATFLLENTGNVALESMRAAVTCAGEPPTEVQDDQPFLSRPDNRPPQGSMLHAGGLAFLAIEIGRFGADTTCEARFMFYSGDGGGGLATDRIVVAFTIEGERPSPSPIPQDPLGNIRRLIGRLRDRGHVLVTYENGCEDGTAPDPPDLHAEHGGGCDADVTWWSPCFSELGFTLYRYDATTAGDFVMISEFPPAQGAVWTTDAVPQAGDYYYYAVASNQFGDAASDISRAQVPVDACPAAAPSAESNLVTVEVEVLDGLVGSGYDRVYCLASLQGPPELRFPLDQDEFFLVEGSNFNIAEYLGGDHSRLVTVSADDALHVFFECYGWPQDGEPDLPDPLGDFTNLHWGEDWDGGLLIGHGDLFRLEYVINRVPAPDIPEEPVEGVAYEGYACPYVPVPQDLEVRADRLRWTWTDSLDYIEGFWILQNGLRAQWVDTSSVGTVSGEPDRYSLKLDDFLASPPCESGGYLSMVAGLKDEPWASDPCYNSVPSETVQLWGPRCEAQVTVRFDTIEFPWLDGGTAAVYGYLVALDEHLGLGLPYYDDPSFFRADPGITYRFADLGVLVARYEMVRAGEWVIGQYRASEPELSVDLDENTPLDITIELYELWSNEILCFSHVTNAALPPEGWARVNTTSSTFGSSEHGSCEVTYTVFGTASD
jgi:hypothetical protein